MGWGGIESERVGTTSKGVERPKRRGYSCLKRRRIYARIGQVFNEFLNVVNDAVAAAGDNGEVCTSPPLFLPPCRAANLYYATRGEFLSRRALYVALACVSRCGALDSSLIRINGDKMVYSSRR